MRERVGKKARGRGGGEVFDGAIIRDGFVRSDQREAIIQILDNSVRNSFARISPGHPQLSKRATFDRTRTNT